tara:strand:- start:5678 stop:6814 length:1137 start_codon:yes stop_codon:yes gene_type:complete
MSKIPKSLSELVDDAIKSAKGARAVAQDAKPLRNVLPSVTATPSRIKGNTSGYSGLVKPYKPEDVIVTRKIVNPNVQNKQVIDPSALQGGHMLGWTGDRANAGSVIEAIDGRKLSVPVREQGGGDWMMDNPESIMASEYGTSTGLLNKLNELAESGSPVYSNHLLMSGKAVDFNKMISDLFSGSLGRINAKTAKDIDKHIRNFAIRNKKTGVTTYPYRGFVGINSDELPNWLAGISGSNRSNFMKMMDKKGIQSVEGIPDIGKLRIANTAPELLNAPDMSSGFAIGKYNPEVGRIINPSVTHNTYNSQIAGSPMGTFGIQLPYETVFPDFSKLMQTKYIKSINNPTYMAMLDPPIQYLDQEWVDNLSQAIENFRKLKE